MNITDSELCMLEQLTYLQGDRAEAIAEALGLKGFKGVVGKNGYTIAEILACFDEEALAKLEALGDKDLGDISAKEWAQIIRYLQTSDLSSLVLADIMVDSRGETMALCFAEEGNTEDAVVAFKGTEGYEEWVDDVEGFNQSDTQYQTEALDYIESLPYENITVTGHSKGGNKAMYVAVTSDKVTRCVSFDGQGFSAEFLEKYWAEIEAKAGNITCYSLSTDFVHILMYYLPGAEQIYCAGYGVEDAAENHSFNSFFTTDENGNLIFGEDGNPTFTITSEDEALTTLHEFTAFMLNNASDEDKQLFVEFISEILAMAMCGGTDKILDFITAEENQEALVTVIAYLSRFMAENDISGEYVCDLLDALGISEVYEKYTYNILGKEVNIVELLLKVIVDNTVVRINNQLNDNDNDAFLTWVLDHLGLTDISALWTKINSKVQNINISGGSADAQIKSGTVRDFSLSVYDALMNAINRIESLGGTSVSSWSNYSGEEWYSSLLVSTAIKGINRYFSKLTQTNQTCKAGIETVFNNVNAVDNTVSMRLALRCLELQKIKTGITAVADSIVV